MGQLESKYLYILPPTLNRKGEPIGNTNHDIKELFFYKTDIYKLNSPILITSDLHSHSKTIFFDLSKRIDLTKIVVILLGDMGGPLISGKDGCVLDLLKFLITKCKKLLFIGGNHDVPVNMDILKNLSNKDGTPIYYESGTILNFRFGKVGLVHGTGNHISNKPFEYSPDDYINYLSLLDGSDIILTHAAPKFPVENNIILEKNKYGDERIYNCINNFIKKPKFHFYGHAHHEEVPFINSYTTYYNLDSRIYIYNYDGNIQTNDIKNNQIKKYTYIPYDHVLSQ